MAKKKYYGIKEGSRLGVFDNWNETKTFVIGYPGAKYKSFSDYDEAFFYVYGYSPKDRTKMHRSEKENLPKSSFVSLSPKNSKRTKTKNSVDVFVSGFYNHEDDSIGYGLVFLMNDGSYMKDCGRIPTNETSSKDIFGEVYAVIRTIQMAMANEITHVAIHYYHEGIEKWARNEWKPQTPISKHYESYFKKQVLEDKKVRILFRRTSSENKHNMMANDLAMVGCFL